MIRSRANAAICCVAIAFMVVALPVRAVEEVEVVALFKDKVVVMIDGKRRLLEKGESSPENVRLISSDSRSAVLEIDGEQRSYQLGQRISSSFSQRKVRATEIVQDEQGMFNVVGSINGIGVQFVVDTGATLVAMNSRVARRLGIDYLLVGEKAYASTASGVVRTYNVNLRQVRVGDIELHNVRGSVIEGDYPEITLLGMSFLGRVEMKRNGLIMELRSKP